MRLVPLKNPNPVARLLLVGLLLCSSTQGLAVARFVGADLNGVPCEGDAQGYGPYDYVNPQHRANHLHIVEQYHFTTAVKQLIKGSSGTVYTDIAYTLRAFPNHHLALYSLIKLKLLNDRRSEQIKVPPECYLQRAMAFNPGDPGPHIVYGVYLHQLKRYQEAIDEYSRAEQLNSTSIELLYNKGLSYFALGDLDSAHDYAKKAYTAGFPLPGLMNKLKKKGHWEQ